MKKTPIPMTIIESFSAVMSEETKYLVTNSGPQIIKFCSGIIAPLMKNKILNAPNTFLGKNDILLAISKNPLNIESNDKYMI